MTQEESNEDFFARNYFDETNHKEKASYYTNLMLSKIADRLTGLNFLIAELNDNLSNINHNIAQIGSKK